MQVAARFYICVGMWIGSGCQPPVASSVEQPTPRAAGTHGANETSEVRTSTSAMDAISPSIAPAHTAPAYNTAPTGTAALNSEPVNGLIDGQATNTGIEYRARTTTPSNLALDGVVDEWFSPAAATATAVTIALLPHSFWLTFVVPEPSAPQLVFELELPSDALPEIGAIVRGGGTYDVNCNHAPWDAERPFTPQFKRKCLATVARYEALSKAQKRRFKRHLTFERERQVWTSQDGTLVRPLAQYCVTTSQRVSCEVQFPLLELPRTSRNRITNVGLGLKLTPSQQAQLAWVNLPAPALFEPGLNLRELVWQDESQLPEADRHSYQPGDSAGFETAARNEAGLGSFITDVTIESCRLSAPWVELGRVSLHRLCGTHALLLVFLDGRPHHRLVRGGESFVIRNGEIHVFDRTSFLDDAGFAAKGWVVAQVSAEGDVNERVLTSSTNSFPGGCKAAGLHHDPTYATMEVSCLLMGEGDTNVQWVKKKLTWSEQRHEYEVLAPKGFHE